MVLLMVTRTFNLVSASRCLPIKEGARAPFRKLQASTRLPLGKAGEASAHSLQCWEVKFFIGPPVFHHYRSRAIFGQTILVPTYAGWKGLQSVLSEIYANTTVILQYPKIWVFFQFFGKINLKN